jgi:hypothetical protein
VSNLINPADLISSTTTLGGNGPAVRILVCHTCKSMTPIPDHGGQGDDDMLVSRVLEHQFDPVHISRNEIQTRPHEMILCRAPKALWDSDSLRPKLVAEIQKHTVGAGQAEGLGELYDVKSNFMEDAMRCWRFAHGRTANCDDYRSDKMRLLPDSVAERRELGLDPGERPVQYLCQYCPVESIVQQRRNKKKGLYN